MAVHFGVQNEKECFRTKKNGKSTPDSRKVCLTKVSTVNKAIDFFEHVCYND